MTLQYHALTQLKKHHPAWRLLQADYAPLIASFLDHAFIQPNERILSQSILVSKLEDLLFQLREQEGEAQYTRDAKFYLDDWAKNDKGWLRKFYPQNSDEPHYDLMPATEKALAWLENLAEKQFVGTESRLLMIFELLRQMVSGAEADPEMRIRALNTRKAEIDQQIQSLREGHLTLMDETSLRDRYQQINSTARELLGDFRAVEHNFRALDRAVREKIACWEGSKGELLQAIFGERDAIADSDQGRSFQAFWDFLMSPASQEELTDLLEKIFEMDALASFKTDKRLKRIHFDWLEAGEYTQRTVAKLSQQLRRYLDDQAWLENKRIMKILDNISTGALIAKQQLPEGPWMWLDECAPDLQFPMEKPLYTPPLKAVIEDKVLAGTADDLIPEKLFYQIHVDKKQLKAQIHQARGIHKQVTLKQVVTLFPLKHGLEELLVYLAIASESQHTVFDEDYPEYIDWLVGEGISKQTLLPRIIYTRVA